MLELKNIKKVYKVGEFETIALNGISMAFREREFVAILGASGSGKTTCLNIIGGLDRYDSGSMSIKGKNTTDFKEKDWDAYRNNSIGFVFQSYNLITHLSIVANVELGMTLSGVSKSEKRQRAVEVLTQVGLKKHLHKKPNQLSGGQMQRVAIARALANNPEILLCDEPTGALDSETSKQIMDLIRELSKERLVIMVTHNPEIAEAYADRMIKFEDGVVVSDSNPHEERPKPDMFNLKKTAMNFLTALNLSGNNILTKKGRTFLTAFASSIGIIGIAVILSLSYGFQQQIDKFQEDAMAEFPILISRDVMDVNYDELEKAQAERNKNSEDKEEDGDSPPPSEITIYDPTKFIKSHTNDFNDDYLKYIEDIKPDIASYVGYQRMLDVNVLRYNDGADGPEPITFPTIMTMMTGGGAQIGGDMSSMMGSGGGIGLSTYPVKLGEDVEGYMEKNYELLHGSFPQSPTDILLIVGENGRLQKSTLESLGFDVSGARETISFEEVIDAKFKLIDNDDYYTDNPVGGDSEPLSEEERIAALPEDVRAAIEGGMMTLKMYEMFSQEARDAIESETMTLEEVLAAMPPEALEALQTAAAETPEASEEEPLRKFYNSEDYQGMWDSGESLDLNITGIVRAKDSSGIQLLMDGIVYSDELCQLVIERAEDSQIVVEQSKREDKVISNPFFTRELVLSSLGGDAALYAITIYPTSFENKDKLIEYLDKWNEGKECICDPCENCKNLTDKEEWCDDCKAKVCGQIVHSDIAATILGFMSDIIHAVTIVLIAFAAISLVVSLIMIAIITYVSVLERTKEIGILRALGARRKDITRVFDAETFIIGAFSGIIGVLIAWGLTFPANMIIESMTNLPNVAKLNIFYVIILVILSTLLTVIGGHLPARMAANRDAVEALRSE